MSSNNKELNCVFCNLSFDKKEDLQVHFRKHADPTFKGNKKKPESEPVSCEVCSEVFQSISKAITHKHKMHPNHDLKYFCPWCGKLFTMKHLFNKHLEKNHENKIEPDLILNCDPCDVKFFLPSAMRYHNKFFHRLDSDQHPIGRSLKKQILNEEVLDIMYCPFCGEEYNNKVNIDKHIRDDHGDEENAVDIFRCPLCDALFFHLDAYELHLTFHSSDDMYEYSKDAQKSTKNISEFSLDTVPPMLEKMEDNNTTPTSSMASEQAAVGIEQFLQIAMNEPMDNDNVEFEKPEKIKVKKHKKHKKSKKSAITLDEFLSMNKDVFGEELDFHGAVEVTKPEIAKNTKNKLLALKTPQKIFSSTQLDKLKGQGITIKNHSDQTTTRNTVSVDKMPKNDNENKNEVTFHSINTSDDVLSKLINQSNCQLKITRKTINQSPQIEASESVKIEESEQSKNQEEDNIIEKDQNYDEFADKKLSETKCSDLLEEPRTSDNGDDLLNEHESHKSGDSDLGKNMTPHSKSPVADSVDSFMLSNSDDLELSIKPNRIIVNKPQNKLPINLRDEEVATLVVNTIPKTDSDKTQNTIIALPYYPISDAKAELEESNECSENIKVFKNLSDVTVKAVSQHSASISGNYGPTVSSDDKVLKRDLIGEFENSKSECSETFDEELKSQQTSLTHLEQSPVNILKNLKNITVKSSKQPKEEQMCEGEIYNVDDSDSDDFNLNVPVLQSKEISQTNNSCMQNVSSQKAVIINKASVPGEKTKSNLDYKQAATPLKLINQNSDCFSLNKTKPNIHTKYKNYEADSTKLSSSSLLPKLNHNEQKSFQSMKVHKNAIETLTSNSNFDDEDWDDLDYESDSSTSKVKITELKNEDIITQEHIDEEFFNDESEKDHFNDLNADATTNTELGKINLSNLKNITIKKVNDKQNEEKRLMPCIQAKNQNTAKTVKTVGISKKPQNLNEINAVGKQYKVETFNTETVIQEITTVTKTIRTVNQSVQQNVTSSSQNLHNNNRNSVSKAAKQQTQIQGMKVLKSSNETVKNIPPNSQSSKIQLLNPPRHAISNIVRQISPKTQQIRNITPRPTLSTTVRPKNQTINIGQNTFVSRPRMPVINKTQPTSNMIKPVNKVMKMSPHIQNACVKRPASTEISSSSFIKKSKESIVSTNCPDYSDDDMEPISNLATQSQVKSQYSSINKTVKNGSNVTVMKSENMISSQEHITKLGNVPGLKVVKNTFVNQSNEISSATSNDNSTLSAIEKLKRQGLLVKKPQVEEEYDQDSDEIPDNCVIEEFE